MFWKMRMCTNEVKEWENVRAKMGIERENERAKKKRFEWGNKRVSKYLFHSLSLRSSFPSPTLFFFFFGHCSSCYVIIIMCATIARDECLHESHPFLLYNIRTVAHKRNTKPIALCQWNIIRFKLNTSLLSFSVLSSLFLFLCRSILPLPLSLSYRKKKCPAPYSGANIDEEAFITFDDQPSFLKQLIRIPNIMRPMNGEVGKKHFRLVKYLLWYSMRIVCVFVEIFNLRMARNAQTKAKRTEQNRTEQKRKEQNISTTIKPWVAVKSLKSLHGVCLCVVCLSACAYHESVLSL